MSSISAAVVSTKSDSMAAGLAKGSPATVPATGFQFNPNSREFSPMMSWVEPTLPTPSPPVSSNLINFDCFSSEDEGPPAQKKTAPWRQGVQDSLNDTPEAPKSKPWRKNVSKDVEEGAAKEEVAPSKVVSRPWRKAAEGKEDEGATPPWRKTLDMDDEKKSTETPNETSRPWKKSPPWAKKTEAKGQAKDDEVKAKAPENTQDRPDQERMLSSPIGGSYMSLSEASTCATPTAHLDTGDSSEATEEEESVSENDNVKKEPAKSVPSPCRSQPRLAPSGMLSGSLTSKLTMSLAPQRRSQPKSEGFSVSAMLKWRAAAQAEGLCDKNVVYGLEKIPESELARIASLEAPKAESTEKNNWREHSKKSPKGEKSPKGDADDEWRSLRKAPEPVVLEQSETSWAARQKQIKEEKRRKDSGKSDEEIVREMKSILNKLTIEKYDTLYQKMLGCGISTVEHVKTLIHEVMEKATTQHHFINMYAQFCSHLNEWFVENKVSSDPKTSFKRILLNECQNAFERHLRPIDVQGLQGDDLDAAKLKYKLVMLGNIRFVGALLEKKMLASSVLIGVAEELSSDPSTPEALESLAVFLTSVGGTFDRSDWSYHKRFEAVIEQVQKKTKDKAVPARIRFLLQDVLDLRSTGWSDMKKATKKNEGPMKLDDVHGKAAQEEQTAYVAVR